MDTFSLIFLSLVPTGIVASVSYYVVKAFLDREHERQEMKLKMQSKEVALPLQLQAYERMTLYLERIAPNNLVLRLNASDELKAVEMQQIMVDEIREEYNHNAAQQVYISEDGWNAVIQAKEEMIALINNVGESLENEAPAIEFAKTLFQAVINANDDVVTEKLKILKKEAQKLL